jgi:PIN domain nuclease of toxin-antitoxin system
MNLLLDTHAILWFLANDPKLTAAALAAILDPANIRWVSPISLLEIALKNRLGKLPLPDAFGVMFPDSLTASDIHLLPLEPQHIGPLTTLPLHHKDPFDRLLAATATVEGFSLVSADPVFDLYGLTRLW